MIEKKVRRTHRATSTALHRRLWIVVAAALGVAFAAAAGEGGAATSPDSVQATSLVTSQDFEGTTFPPTGWRIVDQLYSPARFLWDRETCEVEPGAGGTASAWALGGGAGGSGLSCGADYTEAVDAFLIYGPIDTRAYDLGIRVALDVWLDIPSSSAFLVCATHGTGDEDFQCFETGLTETDWESFAPLNFPLTAGRTDVEIWINYRDRQPAGGHVGAFVDNVVIEGLSSGAVPTATASATRTSTPAGTPGATWTATRTATSGPSTTPSASPTASRTATASGTASRTPTAGASSTSTRTATATAAASSTRTSIATPDGTTTRTPTRTPTATSTSTRTSGATLQPTLTTPTTATATTTPSRTGTAEWTPTDRPTGSVTEASTPVATASATERPQGEYTVFLPLTNCRK